MAELEKVLQQNKGCKIAFYGFGTETGKFIAEWGGRISITGFLDGFRSEDGGSYRCHGGEYFFQECESQRADGTLLDLEEPLGHGTGYPVWPVPLPEAASSGR